MLHLQEKTRSIEVETMKRRGKLIYGDTMTEDEIQRVRGAILRGLFAERVH